MILRSLALKSGMMAYKILRGASPGELPIGEPNKFLLAVNLKTAKSLELTVPQPLLLLADQVIE